MSKFKTATSNGLALLLVLLVGWGAALGADGDGDGVIDSLDNCPATATGEVVNSDGCSVADLCPCAGPAPGTSWTNHGEYISCVTHTVHDFVDQGLIARSQRGVIVTAAARSGCGHENAETTEALTIQTFGEDLDFAGEEGVLVSIDGTQVGFTGVGGTLTLELAANQEYHIRVLDVGVVGGRATIFLKANSSGTETVQIVMTGDSGVLEDAELVVDGVSNRVLDSMFTELGMHFEYRNGEVAHLTRFNYLFLRSPRNDDEKIEVTTLFDLDPEGRLILNDVEEFRSRLLSLPSGEVTIEAYGADAQGFVFANRAQFYVGRFSLTGLLLAPPSKPSLNIAGLAVEARLLRDEDIVRTAVSGPSGLFFFHALPVGNWKITATTSSSGVAYNGFATLSLMDNIGVRITLRSTIDILNDGSSLINGWLDRIVGRPSRKPASAGAKWEGNSSSQASRPNGDWRNRPP